MERKLRIWEEMRIIYSYLELALSHFSETYAVKHRQRGASLNTKFWHMPNTLIDGSIRSRFGIKRVRKIQVSRERRSLIEKKQDIEMKSSIHL